MPETLSWSLIFGAVKAGHQIIDDDKRAALIKKIKLLIRSNRKIVVFGISGAGKSQFINSLKRNLQIAERTLSTEKIAHEIEDFPIIFIDTPGHSERSTFRKKEVTDILRNGVEGIINVVSYGYEENLESETANIFQPNGAVKESFLNQNRKAEIERLSEWLPLIQPNDIRWMINLVTKADIWWENLAEANQYYEKGDYSEAFKSISNYTHVLTVPYCSIIKPYYGVKTSGAFGEIEKAQMYNYLVHLLLNLLKEE